MNQNTECPQCERVFEVPSESFDTNVVCPACKSKFNPMTESVNATWKAKNEADYHTYRTGESAQSESTINHAEFVAGMKNGTIGFECPLGKPYRLIRKKPGGELSAIFMLLAFVGPVVIVPLWAYHEGKWWLLFGILISLTATSWEKDEGISCMFGNTSVIQTGKGAGGVLLLASICLLIWKGIHSYFTFFALSALWGCMLWRISERFQWEYAMESLIENPHLFKTALESKMIRLISRDAKDGKKGRA